MTALSCICSKLPYKRAPGALFSPPALRHASSQSEPSTSASPEISQGAPPGEADSVAAAAVGGAPDTNSGRGGRFGKQIGPTAWLKSPEGLQFKRPAAGRTNWIGRTPYPLNPSFRPPTPLSDVQKTRIYRAFVEAVKSQGQQQDNSSSSSSADGSKAAPAKSETFFVRKLALQYNLSMDRIRAVVRLKALEENMQKQGKTLQGKFMVGMEGALGVSTGGTGSVAVQGLKEPVPGMAYETKEGYATGKKSHWIMVDEEAGEESVTAAAAQITQSPASATKGEARRAPSRRSNAAPSFRNANPESRQRSGKRELGFVDVSSSRPQARSSK